MNDEVGDAIRLYFAGERAEMWMILAGSALALALAAAHVTIARDAFARGLGAVMILGVLMLAGTAIALLRRDPGIESTLMASLSQESRSAALTAERTRIRTVISKYPTYRHVGVGLALVALVAVLMTRKPVVNGVAAGVLLLTCTLLVVDHYSEQRARAYVARLDGPGP